MGKNNWLPRVAASAAVLGACAVAAPANAADAAEGGGRLARYHAQELDWHGCALGPEDEVGRELDAAGADCTELTVPLDYAEPGGKTITIALSRLPATDQEHRVGPLFLNNGGPGGAGLDMPLTVGAAMGDVAERFDLIGMDPRFVGRSTPLDCGWDIGTGIYSAGPDRASFAASAARARELAERCRRAAGDLLPHVSTRNTARDMDVLRGALGEDRISYLGYSYGSYLGEVYAALFPGRTDRMVLDGVIHPDRYRQTLLQGAEAANESALRGWADWVAERDDAYGLGASRDAVLAAVDRIHRAAAEEPLEVGEFRLDAHLLPIVFFGGLGSDLDERRAALAESAAALARAAAGEQVEPGPGLAEELAWLTTGAGSRQASAQTAIICGDVAERRGLGAYWRDIQGSRAAYPFAGPLASNVNPCEYWGRPAEAPTALPDDVPALLVAATGDPRTVYEGTTEVRADWPSSRLVTVAGAAQHGLFGEYGNACVDARVNAYLAEGRLPARDLTCRP